MLYSLYRSIMQVWLLDVICWGVHGAGTPPRSRLPRVASAIFLTVLWLQKVVDLSVR